MNLSISISSTHKLLNLIRQFQDSFILKADKKSETHGKPSKARSGLVAEIREEDQQHGEGVDQSGKDPNNRKYEEWTEKAQKEVGSSHKRAPFQDPTGGRKA